MDYQLTKVLCERVKQLENGYPPLIDKKELISLGLVDSYSVAKLELSRGLLKYNIKFIKPSEFYK